MKFIREIITLIGLFFVGYCILNPVEVYKEMFKEEEQYEEYYEDEYYEEEYYEEESFDYYYGDYNCDDFSNQAEAQAFFESSGGVAHDDNDLDRDGDGLACEWN